MDLGFLSDAWGSFQDAYGWWTSEGPGAGASPPPASPPVPGYGGSGGGFALPSWLLIVAAGVVAWMIFKK